MAGPGLVLCIALAGLWAASCRAGEPASKMDNEVFVGIDLPTCRIIDSPPGDKPTMLFHSERMGAAESPNWIVITADPLLDVAKEWARYRTSEGYNTQVISVSQVLAGRSLVAEQFLRTVRTRLIMELGTSRPQGTIYLLLLGDSRDTDLHPEVTAAMVPTISHQGQYLTDLPYSDLNGDGLPDLALGRVPVRNIEQAEVVLHKTIRYEQTENPGPWRHRLLLFASQGGFGPLVDALMERVGLDLLSALPQQWNITFLHARPGSAYGLPPRQYTKTLIRLFDEGSVLAVYTGHGYLDSLEDVTWGPNDQAAILDIPAIEDMTCDAHCPVVVLAACHTGDFGHGTSLAEAMERTDNGPPALVAATDVSHPFPNVMLAFKLVRLVSKREVSTLGHAFLEALLSLGQPETLAELRLDRLVTLVWSQEDLRDILDDNRRMYVLLGDPALKLPLSKTVLHLGYHRVDDRRILVCGKVSGIQSGIVDVSLLRPRLQIPAQLDGNHIPATAAEALARWRAANDRIVTEQTVLLENGTFSSMIELPEGPTTAPLVLRALVVGPDDDAAAALTLPKEEVGADSERASFRQIRSTHRTATRPLVPNSSRY